MNQTIIEIRLQIAALKDGYADKSLKDPRLVIESLCDLGNALADLVEAKS